MLSKKDKKQLEEAAKATKKLNTYSKGVFAAGGRDATKKYEELNGKADKAIKALPVHLRARVIIERFEK